MQQRAITLTELQIEEKWCVCQIGHKCTVSKISIKPLKITPQNYSFITAIVIHSLI